MSEVRSWIDKGPPPVEVVGASDYRDALEKIGRLRAALELIAKAKDVRGCDEIARQALVGVETSPVLPCDKCGRGVDEHVGIGMPCPETESLP